MWQILGFVGGVIVLVGYFVSVRYERPAVLDWANIVGAVIMLYPNIYFEAFFGAMLTASFGLIGLYGVLRRRSGVGCESWMEHT